MPATYFVKATGLDEAHRKIVATGDRSRIVRGARFFIRKRLEEQLEPIRQEAPVESGVLRDSIVLEISETEESIKGSYVANAAHAAWVARGTGEFGPSGQRIVPVNRPYMVFFKEGKWVRTRIVRGQSPNPFLRRGAEIALAGIRTTVPKRIRDDIRIIMGGNV
jgi:hypothetical protein